jgi:heme-degrading monooxygenase HmoA
MTPYFLYAQEVHAVLAPASWDEAYFSLLSLKHALAGVPGWKRLDFLANNQDDDMIHMRVITTWDTVVQMEAWVASDLTVEGVLKALTPPPVEMEISFYEKIS